MFYLSPDDFAYKHACGCQGIPYTGTVTDMAIDLTQRSVADYLGVKNDPDEPEFINYELATAIALAENAIRMFPSMEAIIGPTLHEDMNADVVLEAIEEAAAEWQREAVNERTSDRIEQTMVLALAAGALVASDAFVLEGGFRRSIVDGMVDASNYYTNQFFNTQVMPSLHAAVEKSISNPAGATTDFRNIRAVMDKRLKSVPYWRVVGNAAASRAYHFGLLRAAEQSGRGRAFRFVAVLDARTSAICQSLDGTEWPVRTGVEFMERIAKVQHPEDIKDIAPWMSNDDIQGMSPDQLAEAGVIVPPLHGNCRSSIAVI